MNKILKIFSILMGILAIAGFIGIFRTETSGGQDFFVAMFMFSTMFSIVSFTSYKRFVEEDKKFYKMD